MKNILILGQKKIFFECFKFFLEAKDKFKDLRVVDVVSDISFSDHEKEIDFHNCLDISWEYLQKIIAEKKISVLISIQYSKIIPDFILKMVDYKCFNLHNAKLPDYRGHNSLTYEILNNEKEHQITIHWMVAEVDRGFTALTKSIQISNFDTAYSVYNKCLEEAPKLFLKFMEMLENNDLPKTPIVGEGHYYSLVLNKEVSDGLSVEDMEKYSRAFFFPECEPAYLLSGEKKLYLLPEVFWKK